MPFQIHSPDGRHNRAVRKARPGAMRQTATPGLALGVTGADCGMILFADPRAHVIGAACGLERLTAWSSDRDGDGGLALSAATSSPGWPASAETPTRLVQSSSPPSTARATHPAPTSPSRRAGRSCSTQRLSPNAPRAGLNLRGSSPDTHADERRFFSYRRATHRKNRTMAGSYRYRHGLGRRTQFRLLDRLSAPTN